MPQNSSSRRARTVSVLALTGLLALTACEADVPDQQGGGDVGDYDAESFDELAAPDPSGNQLSHEDMRGVLEDHFDGAGLTDTDDYYPNLRDIETELQKLAVDPADCKQYVVQSASPVPEGALVVHADSSGGQGEEGEGSGDAGSQEGSQEGSQGGGSQEGSQGGGSEGDGQGGDPAASSGGFSTTSVTRPFDNEGGDDGSGDEDSGDEGSGDEEDGSGEDGAEGEEEDEPVEVDLPSGRQATVYSFQDSRASDAFFDGEETGLENCGSYTVTRGGIGEDEEPDAETSTSVDAVEVDSEADGALGIYREVEADDSTERSVAVMLRHGSQTVLLVAPAGGELDEDESEVAVEELEEEAHAVLEDL